MQESVYKKEGQTQKKIKIPKNIKQIGEMPSGCRLYLEDYVAGYLNQIAHISVNELKAAVLLGNIREEKEQQFVFAQGAVEIEEVTVKDSEITFEEEAWNKAYEQIQKYFDEYIIIGWYLYDENGNYSELQSLYNVHMKHFSNNHTILLKSTENSTEEELYRLEQNVLNRQSGYCIYYDKNECMEKYMIDKNKEQNREEMPDKTVQNFRTIIKKRKEDIQQKKTLRFMYAASTFLILVICVMGVTMLNNYEQMKNMEQTLNMISQNVAVQETGGQAVVEHLEGNVNPVEEQQDTAQTEQTEDTPKSTETVSKPDNTETTQAVTQTQTQTEQPVQTAPKEYTIQAGDTLLSISRKLYQTDTMVQKICELNQLENSDQIKAGEKIILP